MTLVTLNSQDQAIRDAARLDYFWDSIPFADLHTALDIGAHIGIWSELCHERAPHIEITAVEPHIENYNQLVQHCPYATTVYGWCGYRDDAIALCCREGMEGSHYVFGGGDVPAVGSYTISLPQRYKLEDFGQIDLLKLDCEGSEFDILLHCEDRTLRMIEVIVGEYHLDFGHFSTIVKRLSAFGFDITIVPHESAPHLGHFLARKTDR